ncbi:MAG TPA: hypothetical protein VJ806_00605 [Luteimonas sp.]|nr:hypothetical protein [Luteimonas sp.]
MDATIFAGEAFRWNGLHQSPSIHVRLSNFHMPRYLHIFQVGGTPTRFTVFEFESHAPRPAFETELITWGAEREHTLPELAIMLYGRGWLLSEIAVAVESAEKRTIQGEAHRR